MKWHYKRSSSPESYLLSIFPCWVPTNRPYLALICPDLIIPVLYHMNKVRALPGAFPLHEDRNFLSESEWVIFKLLCRPVESFSNTNAEELSAATGHQVTPDRCCELINIVRIQQLPGLGSWISRLLAETGFSDNEIRNLPASQIFGRLNDKLGYALCNDATTRALAALQLQWKGAEV